MESVYHWLKKNGHFQDAAYYRFGYFTGMRFNEMWGLSLDDIYDGKIHDENFQQRLEEHGLGEYPGYVVLESQPALSKASLRQNGTGKILRKPLKGRKSIEERFARTIVILDRQLWEDLKVLYNEKLAQYHRRKWGPDLRDYALFDKVHRSGATIC